MRDLTDPALRPYATRLGNLPPNTPWAGCFFIPSPVAPGAKLKVIATASHGWDHASISLPNRCPNWPEMSRVKELLFFDDEVAMQVHVPSADHINIHPYCLHLWRPHDGGIPRPPAEMVGLPGITIEQARAMSAKERLAIQQKARRQMEDRLG